MLPQAIVHAITPLSSVLRCAMFTGEKVHIADFVPRFELLLANC